MIASLLYSLSLSFTGRPRSIVIARGLWNTAAAGKLPEPFALRGQLEKGTDVFYLNAADEYYIYVLVVLFLLARPFPCSFCSASIHPIERPFVVPCLVHLGSFSLALAGIFPCYDRTPACGCCKQAHCTRKEAASETLACRSGLPYYIRH